MKFKDAAYEILLKAEEPLHYYEITDRASEAGLLTTEGLTPHASMGALLYTDTLKENSRFRRGDTKGTFALRIEPSTDIQVQINGINANVRKTLRKRLLQMNPRKFENLVKLLLDAMGLEETSVSTYSGDGGIDVRGILNAENLSKINVAVQAKRWKANVGAKVIRELRGSLKVHEHGIVITPSDFTPSAVAEADDPGKVQISLINGDELVALLIEHQVGIADVEYIVNSLDEDFWSEILGDDFTQTEHPKNPTKTKEEHYSVKFPLKILANHKGKVYYAELHDLGGNVLFNGSLFETPSAAAKAVAVTWQSVNGWDFWKFEDTISGKPVKIGKLRQERWEIR